MGETTQPPVDWRALAEAMPGGVAVQVDGEFVHVSGELAAAAGTTAETLTGDSWRTLFEPPETERVERALATARADGRWQGAVRVTPDEMADGTRALDATLSAADGAIVWILREGEDRREAVDGDTGKLDERDDGTGEPDERDDGAGERENPTGRERDGAPDERDDVAPTGRPAELFTRPTFARTLFDGIDDVLYVLDEDGEMVLWNETLAERTGYTHAEISEMHSKEFVPADQHELVPGLIRAIESIEDRRVDVDLLTRDGERITHEFQGTTFEDPETGQRFRCGLARDVSDERDRERQFRRQRTLIKGLLNAVPDVIFGYDEDGDHIVEDALLDEFAGYSKAELAEMELLDFLPEDDREEAEAVFDRVLEDGETVNYESAIVSKDGEATPREFRAAPMEFDGERSIVAAARDVTERLRRERELQRQRDDLATLDRINELLLDTVRELVETASREAVERAVCERLAASELYEFAWVGERAFDGPRIVPRASAGDGQGYLDEVTITADNADTGAGPAGEALRTGEVQVANTDDPRFEPWREAARERGFASIAAVPLYDESVYGVLVVYATREDAFSEREQSGFDVLGRTIGAVIHAARSRDLLFADTVVELEFRLDGDADSVLVRTAADVGCELSLDGYVAAGEQWVLYLDVDGAPPAAVVDAMAADPLVDRARVLAGGDDGGRVEVVVSEASLLHTTTAAGAVVRSVDAEPGGATLVVEAPADADVRVVADHVGRAYDGADLRARRERDREVTTVGRPGGLLDELTARQREALEAAYRAGYHAWPRESTAEEVAASLDLASPTLHGHLRKAEQALLARLFDAEQPGPSAEP